MHTINGKREKSNNKEREGKMPIDYRKYPKDWKTRIRPDILKRANGRCELCGVANGSTIYRCSYIKTNYIGTIECKTPVKVVLTVAHMDHDIQNNDYGNLKALCQRCHLRHDAEQHARNARITRRRKKAEQEVRGGQLVMFA